MSTCAIVWFRNDLRIHDNEILARAAMDHDQIIPLYCFDPRHYGQTSYGFPKTGSYRAQFIRESVANLRQNLADRGAELMVRHGKPEEVISELVDQYQVSKIYAQKETTSEEISVEEAVADATDATLELIWGLTLYHLDDLKYEPGQIPDTFTSFRKTTEKYSEIRDVVEMPDAFHTPEDLETGDLPELETLGLEHKPIDDRAVLSFKGGEDAALKRLQNYFWEEDELRNYKYKRNGLLGENYSSKFSPWLAFGCISPRYINSEVKRYEEQRTKNKSTYWLIFELIWRDFFRFSSMKHGDRIFYEGGIQGKQIDWDYDKEKFQKWADGETGIPFIDANMRELNESGFMSNRGRQNVASFLSQNLNLDWRMGAEYFESVLIDYDVCSNWLNWAYNSRVGHDGRNRYFNIIKQAEKYDSKGEYVKHWLPELADVPKAHIHEPHKINEGGGQQQLNFEENASIDYPEPMIDLEASYERIREQRKRE